MSVPPAWRLRCLRAALAVLRSCRLSEGTGVPVDNIQEEFGGEPVAAFSMSHPAVPALYMVLTLGLTMFSMQPVLIALSLAGGLAYGFATRGAARTLGALRWQLPVILIIALVNPLFSASGSTELFRIGMRAVYLESMVYGLCMGGLFVASVLWFEAAASMLEYDKVLALLGNAAPVIALMISMCMRLIPQFLRRGRTVLAVHKRTLGNTPIKPLEHRCLGPGIGKTKASHLNRRRGRAICHTRRRAPIQPSHQPNLFSSIACDAQGSIIQAAYTT